MNETTPALPGVAALKVELAAGFAGVEGPSARARALEIARAIEFSLGATPETPASLDDFAAAAEAWARRRPEGPASFGWRLVRPDPSEPPTPLFLGHRLRRALRGLAGHDRAVLAVLGLEEAVRREHPDTPAGRRAAREALDALGRMTDEMVRRHAPTRTRLVVVRT